MIKSIANKVKNILFGSETELQKLASENEILKSEISSLHEHYDSVIDEMEDGEIKKSFEDVHFADLFKVHSKQKEVSYKLTEVYNNHLEALSKAEEKFKYVDKLNDSLGYKREDMPQVDSENVADFVLHFNDKVGVTKVTRKLSKLKPAQQEIDEDKVYDFLGKHFSDEKPSTSKYIISNDNYLLDGHHRWAAALELSKDDTEVDCYRVNLPAKELIRQAGKLKMTKKKDIEDNILKKALITIAIAKAQGWVSDDLLQLVKASTGQLIPVSRMVRRNGKMHNQIFWVAADQAAEKRNTVVNEDEIPVNQRVAARGNQDAIKQANEAKDAKLFKRQKEDDSITIAGDRVNVKYVGRSSGEKFDFKDMKVLNVDEDSIYCEVPKTITSKKKYSDGTHIIFREGAVIKVAKHNNSKWSLDNNFELAIDKDVRAERLRNINFLDNIKQYAQEAKDKGYSIYEDCLSLNDEQIKAKYAPFFAKYGNSFDPAKMFDNTTERIKEHFTGRELDITSNFTTNGFGITVKDKNTGKSLMTTTRNWNGGESNLPPENNKGIYHAYFAIHDKKYWGGGLAKKLFCEYYEQYEKMGLDHLSVGPGLQSGPYVWPSYGFYAPVRHAENVLRNFRAGNSMEISKYYPESHDHSIEKMYKENNKIFIKYVDSENPIDVTDEKTYTPEGQAQVDALSKTFDDLQIEAMSISGRALEDYKGKDKLTEAEADESLNPLRQQMDEIDRQISNVQKVTRYASDNGDIYEPAKTLTHTISPEEEAEARRIFADFKLRQPNAKNFPSTLWTKNPILRQASKVAYLATGGGGVHHVVDLKNEAHKKDFEHSIGYKQHLKLKYGTE